MTYVLDQPESEQIQRFDQSDVIQVSLSNSEDKSKLPFNLVLPQNL